MYRLPLLLLFLATLRSFSAPPVSVGGIAKSAPAEVSLVFSDDGTGALSDFGIESSTSVTGGSWTPVASATISAVSPGTWLASIPVSPGEPARFFRVLKNGVVLSAAFSAPSVTVDEGASGIGVTVNFTARFTGTLRYQLDGTPGSLQVDNATSAFIPVPVPDDREVGEIRPISLALELEGGAGASYELGATTTTTVIVEDDDAVWAGTLVLPDGGGELAVRILVTEQDGFVTACFKTDGGGLIPPAPDGTQWFFSRFRHAVSEAFFTAQVNDVAIPAEDAFTGVETLLTIAFEASGSENVTAGEIVGDFSIASTAPGSAHLDTPLQVGTFSLFKQPGSAASSTLEN